MAAISTVISAVGVGFGVKGAFDQAKAQRKSDKLSQRRADLESKREKRKLIRNAQVARADIESAGVAGGAQFSSGVAGGKAGVQGRTQDNVLVINQGREIGAGISSASGLANRGKAFTAIGQGLQGNAKLLGRIFGGS